uniref:PAZ domain-containing protein n=1 Tax=Caenorhabditis tropicalis TaxID=1561998 RepID=A0A1I7T0F8_9PELO
MSLLRHLQTYHGDWMSKIQELNELFLSRPPVQFRIYPDEEVVTGRPLISPIAICNTVTRVPDTTEIMMMVDYYRQKRGYRIKGKDQFAIFLDSDPTVYYPAELVYIDNIEECSEFLPNRFTIVI